MVQRCQRVGVGIYVDAVINHMTNYPSPGVGSNGTAYSKYSYPGLYGPGDFHPPCVVDNYQSGGQCPGLRAVLPAGSQYRSPLGPAEDRRLPDHAGAFRGRRLSHRRGETHPAGGARRHSRDRGFHDDGGGTPTAILFSRGERRGREALSPRDYFGEAYGSGGAADITEFTFVGVGDKFRALGGQHISQLNPNGHPAASSRRRRGG